MSPRLAHCGRGPGGWLEAVLHCGRDVLWGQGVIGAKGWGKGAPGMDALVECESSSGPVVKSSLRAPGANRGAGSVIGLRGGAGRARGHPHIRKPSPILPYPQSLPPFLHPHWAPYCSLEHLEKFPADARTQCNVSEHGVMISGPPRLTPRRHTQRDDAHNDWRSRGQSDDQNEQVEARQASCENQDYSARAGKMPRGSAVPRPTPRRARAAGAEVGRPSRHQHRRFGCFLV